MLRNTYTKEIFNGNDKQYIRISKGYSLSLKQKTLMMTSMPCSYFIKINLDLKVRLLLSFTVMNKWGIQFLNLIQLLFEHCWECKHGIDDKVWFIESNRLQFKLKKVKIRKYIGIIYFNFKNHWEFCASMNKGEQGKGISKLEEPDYFAWSNVKPAVCLCLLGLHWKHVKCVYLRIAGIKPNVKIVDASVTAIELFIYWAIPADACTT